LSLPIWWTRKDTVMVQAYHRWEKQSNAFTLADMGGPDGGDWSKEAEAHFASKMCENWTCRRCRYFDSPDGEMGECQGPELACGRVPGFSVCEQWEPREIVAAALGEKGASHD
jgi:hypothetical protein